MHTLRTASLVFGMFLCGCSAAGSSQKPAAVATEVPAVTAPDPFPWKLKEAEPDGSKVMYAHVGSEEGYALAFRCNEVQERLQEQYWIDAASDVETATREHLTAGHMGADVVVRQYDADAGIVRVQVFRRDSAAGEFVIFRGFWSLKHGTEVEKDFSTFVSTFHFSK